MCCESDVSLIYDALKRLELSNDGATAISDGAIPASSVYHGRSRWSMGYGVAFLVFGMILAWLLWQLQAQWRGNGMAIAHVQSTALINPSMTATANRDDTAAARRMVHPLPVEDGHSTGSSLVKVASKDRLAMPQPPNVTHASIPENPPRKPSVYRVKNLNVMKPRRVPANVLPAKAEKAKGRIAVHLAHVPSPAQSIADDAHKTKAIPRESVQEIVAELRLAMAQGNQSNVAVALARLDQRADIHSLIALRMHAYWALKQHEYAMARDYYDQILALRPDDIRAGGNMALLEWRTGEAAAARKRLHALLDIHPDSAMLRHYLDTMGTAR